MLRPLADVAHALSPFGWLLADAEFDSERNHRHVREKIGALSVIPAKRGGASWEVGGYRAEMRAEFPRQLYRRRALVESVFSAVKRKLSTRAPGRSLQTQRIQALLCWAWLTTFTGSSHAPFEQRRTSSIEGCQQSQRISKPRFEVCR